MPTQPESCNPVRWLSHSSLLLHLHALTLNKRWPTSEVPPRAAVLAPDPERSRRAGEIEYRLSFKTKDVEPAGSDFSDAEQAQREQFTSTGKFSVEVTDNYKLALHLALPNSILQIIGKDGTTGPQDLIDHPSMVKNDDGVNHHRLLTRATHLSFTDLEERAWYGASCKDQCRRCRRNQGS